VEYILKRIAKPTLNLMVVLAVLFALSPDSKNHTAYADFPPSILHWSVVDTPNKDLIGNVVVTPSEINRIAIGPYDGEFYAVDIPNNVLYKSTDGGVTWNEELTTALSADGAILPVWDIAVAPDDEKFLVAITNGVAVSDGPKNIFISNDGGQSWQNANINITSGFISCLTISPLYDIDKRYIAVATRDGTGNGEIWTMRAPGSGLWKDQTDPLNSTGWVSGDIVALRFSPAYAFDSTIVVVFANGTGLFLNIGFHDIEGQITTWSSGIGYPVRIPALGSASPTFNQIITADLELPADFSGADPGLLRHYFVSFDAYDGIDYFGGVYRIDNIQDALLLLSSSSQNRISSIAYWGKYDDDAKLLAGEVTTDLTKDLTMGMVNVRECLDLLTTSPLPPWTSTSDNVKLPTGGGNRINPADTFGFANAQLAWDSKGNNIYCVTSSADLLLGDTSWAANTWPQALTTPLPLDESAFSVSRDGGRIWNQLSLIDTEVTFLSDVAITEAPEDSDDYSVLYLSTINKNGAVINTFDSIWRSVSDPLGMRWERVLCTLADNDDLLLRANTRISDDNERSRVIFFADRYSDNIRFSGDEGEFWQKIQNSTTITDFCLVSDADIYILSDRVVKKGIRGTFAWTWSDDIQTGFDFGHTIATPLKNPKRIDGQLEDWVIVGSESTGGIAWADFSQTNIEFLPPPEERKQTPVIGDAHVLCDDSFITNRTIYTSIGKAANGQIYRWKIGESTDWELLEPINSDFYGVAQRTGVLYGAYPAAAVPANPTGVDRTLYPRKEVPPPPEWDDLTADLPIPVQFDREPSSLKISGAADTNLWAIDNINFDWTALPKKGCLWVYTDTLAKNGPWTTAPASGGTIPVDPVTGRTGEVNFAWRQLSYADIYELQIAKDEFFTQRVLVNENIQPSNPVSPAWIHFPGLLEAGHKYYWRARASRASTGEIIRSPWSATMFFTVMAGLPVTSQHLGPTLLQPPNFCTDCSSSPAFSWSPMAKTTEYEFILATDAAFTQVVDKAIVTTTSYEYRGQLERGIMYYWRVQALSPMISESSPIGCFMVANSESPIISLTPEKKPSILLYVGIPIYVVLILALLMFIMKTRFRRIFRIRKYNKW
jgi:hypothetical protein